MPATAQKRPAESALVAVQQTSKRLRNDELQIVTPKDKQLMELGVSRVSNLDSPIMKLEGHEGEIYSCEFHPDGEILGNIFIHILMFSFNKIFSNF
jgi:Prp8 binding protein